MKRGRNQRRRPGGGSNPNRALDSNGPDVRIRGTANQIYDKYLALARDASTSGDRVKAESYLQHAEHYFRVIRAMQPAQQPNQQPGGHEVDGDQPGFDDDTDQRDQRQTRDQRGANGASDADSDAETEDAPAPAPQQAAAPEEHSNGNGAARENDERRPRRRRAPRRPAKADDEGADDAAPTPAAAE